MEIPEAIRSRDDRRAWMTSSCEGFEAESRVLTQMLATAR